MDFKNWVGALLVHKPPGISSYGVIEKLQKSLMAAHGLKRRDLPKMGHGGTLDPFASGLLVVFIGRGVKLAQYFLGSIKTYEGIIRFGETTIPGDPTAPISETSTLLPESIERMRSLAENLTRQDYLQTPPMHSAKKVDGEPLYKLAREGIEIERKPKLCALHRFEILEYSPPRAQIRVICSAGTYIRTLAQDFARLQGTVGMLETLSRTGSGFLHLEKALGLSKIEEATQAGKNWTDLSCWTPFDRLLEGYPQAESTPDEARALFQGKQNILFNILRRAQPTGESDHILAITCHSSLIAIARRESQGPWSLDRVFTPEEGPSQE